MRLKVKDVVAQSETSLARKRAFELYVSVLSMGDNSPEKPSSFKCTTHNTVGTRGGGEGGGLVHQRRSWCSIKQRFTIGDRSSCKGHRAKINFDAFKQLRTITSAKTADEFFLKPSQKLEACSFSVDNRSPG